MKKLILSVVIVALLSTTADAGLFSRLRARRGCGGMARVVKAFVPVRAGAEKLSGGGGLSD